MNTLRVLVVNTDAREAERVAAHLADAQHMAVPAAGLEEAAEALMVQKFDAVLLGCPLPSDGIATLTATLRRLERTQRSATPTPVLSISSHLPDGTGWCAGDQQVDGYVQDSLQPAVLADAIIALGSAIASTAQPRENGASPDPLFEAAEFRAQAGYNEDLMRELIDLFLSECSCQVMEMREALASADFERLGRVAHTVKGSLATLHAAQARVHAQQLELAAKAADHAQCRQALSTLEHDLELLEPELLAFRNAEFAG